MPSADQIFYQLTRISEEPILRLLANLSKVYVEKEMNFFKVVNMCADCAKRLCSIAGRKAIERKSSVEKMLTNKLRNLPRKSAFKNT